MTEFEAWRTYPERLRAAPVLIQNSKEQAMADQERRAGTDRMERGKRASFDPASGEVHGSGAGAGANANPGEDYDNDPIAGDGDDQVGGPRPRSAGIDRATDPDEGV